MSESTPSIPPLFSQVDVSSGAQPHVVLQPSEEHTEIMREMLSAQDRTNELLEELVNAMSATQKQRATELAQWKQANPRLATGCRQAAEALSRVQVEYLEKLTDEIQDSGEDLAYGDFLLNEFIDRYGPRLAHLNGVIQVLAQLSSGSNPTGAQQ